MNPNTNNGGEMHLPAPVVEPGGPVAGAERPAEVPAGGAFETPENQPGRPEQASAAGLLQPPVIPAMPLPGDPTAANNAATNDVSLTTDNVASLSADDSDLIEKEWVNKAKQIIERNSENPHQESQQLTELKADYMKKRYNKTIKLGE